MYSRYFQIVINIIFTRARYNMFVYQLLENYGIKSHLMIMDYGELSENCPPLVKDAHTVPWCYLSTTVFAFAVGSHYLF